MPVTCRLYFEGADNFEGEGRVRDISTHGCQVSSCEPVHVGMVFKLCLFLPDHTWPMQIQEAIVRWVRGTEFGVKFTSIRLAQRERIRGFVMRLKIEERSTHSSRAQEQR